jgi:hypothetical protein
MDQGTDKLMVKCPGLSVTQVESLRNWAIDEDDDYGYYE